MMRIVRHADGSVATDPGGKAPGRGTYVCADSACREPARLADAVRRALAVTAESTRSLAEEIHAAT